MSNLNVSESHDLFLEKVKRYYAENKDELSSPILDGPLNTEEYCKAPIKIAWLLKEAYNDGEEKPFYYYKELIGDYTSSIFLSGGYRTTWHTIVYTSYGILNNKLYNEIPFIKDNNEIANCLHQIAIMNINKGDARGRQVTNMKELKDLFKNHGSKFLLEQLTILCPDVVIYGGTMEIVNSKFNLQRPEYLQTVVGNSITGAYLIDNIIHIDAHHPSHRVNKEKYCNEIIGTSRKLLKQLNKITQVDVT